MTSLALLGRSVEQTATPAGLPGCATKVDIAVRPMTLPSREDQNRTFRGQHIRARVKHGHVTLNGMNSSPADALVKRHDFLAATEVPEVDTWVLTHRPLRSMHDSSAEPAAPGARADEYATRPRNRHLCVTDCDRATLKADVTEKPRLDERQRVDIGWRISIRPIRIPRPVSSEILRVEKLAQGYDFVISKHTMINHTKFLLHPQRLRNRLRDKADPSVMWSVLGLLSI